MGKDRDEPSGGRLDRELNELLQELRVALPGVQVLFAFLLTVPFTQRFTALNSLQRDVYFAAFMATALATALLMAPSAYHRIRFREYDKERLITTSTRLSLAGLAVLVIAVTAVVFLITDLLFSQPGAATAAAIAAGVYVWFWFGLPLTRKVDDGS
jgi:hypothetical protein